MKLLINKKCENEQAYKNIFHVENRILLILGQNIQKAIGYLNNN